MGVGLTSKKSSKRRAQRLCERRRLHALNPRQVQNLISRPVFDQHNLTDVCGARRRADVVRANVERLRGSIHVESIADKAARFD
jgi:chemotaxis protein histidine kinase CheA